MILYLSKNDISALTPSWHSLVDLIEEAVKTLAAQDFAQPVKPYLRYRDPANRIIAMPAYIGGNFDIAGLKWIASFPNNIQNKIPRASAITILNNSETGQPIAILSSDGLSGLRTAAVSGYLIKKMKKFLPQQDLKVGFVGFGPIGQLHAEMVSELLKGQLKELNIYDQRPPLMSSQIPHLKFTHAWEEAGLNADITICSTTSISRYFDKVPKVGSLHLNISLRDYFPEIVMKSSVIIVDDWDEVCRENTDIHKSALDYGLNRQQVVALPELISTDLEILLRERALNPLSNGYISFHPMGMAAFDMAVSQFIYQQAIENKVGVSLAR